MLGVVLCCWVSDPRCGREEGKKENGGERGFVSGKETWSPQTARAQNGHLASGALRSVLEGKRIPLHGSTTVSPAERSRHSPRSKVPVIVS